ncbi:MAG: riboflavin biosynthesis protein RibF [Acutalibacteraceae bacterium]|nr:riboflavin biosynthesis protein RibF [Clostridia bacterium]MEE1329603.1 riboflavin biosynthesis protein RibF [Acutalibacteraceae bacterium]
MKTALALGTFDGVHKGHRAVLNLPNEYKKIAVVFPLPPKAVISGNSLALMTPEDKCRVLKSIGIDRVYMLDFCKVRDMPPYDFLKFLKDTFSPEFISCGFNYRFGKNASGDTQMLSDFCKENAITLQICEPVTVGGETVSSTEIRTLLKNGETEKANCLMTEPFSYTAPVIKGDERGRTLGFPTANQKYPEVLMPVKFGVYKSSVFIDGKAYPAITDIGVRPTFKTDYIISETFIKDFSEDIYGREITVSLLGFIRGEKKFSSVDELVKQVKKDIGSV